MGDTVRFAFWTRRRPEPDESTRPRPILVGAMLTAFALAGASGYLAFDNLLSIARTPGTFVSALEPKRPAASPTVLRRGEQGGVSKDQATPIAMFRTCAYSGQANCVIDGDTIRVAGTKIRLADIDAPEIFSPKCRAEAELGQRATRRLLDLLNAGPVTVAQGADGRDQDDYGRKLRIVARDGRSLGDTLVQEGLAQRWNAPRRNWCG